MKNCAINTLVQPLQGEKGVRPIYSHPCNKQPISVLRRLQMKDGKLNLRKVKRVKNIKIFPVKFFYLRLSLIHYIDYLLYLFTPNAKLYFFERKASQDSENFEPVIFIKATILCETYTCYNNAIKLC